MVSAPSGVDGGLLDDDRLLDLRPRAKRTDAAAVIGEERARQAPTPAANQALREWAPTLAPVPEAPAVAGGLCAVCNARPTRALCRACGRGACAGDLWSMLGVCKSCVAAGRS